MALRLRELTDEELPAFLEAGDRFYVQDLIAHGGMSEERAREKSRRDHAAQLPNGKPQPGHHLCAIEDAETGEAAGRMWFAERDHGVVFLYQIEIRPELRGRGFGRKAMRLLEERARELGATAIELNVYGGNAAARGLYDSLGFAERSVYMAKSV